MSSSVVKLNSGKICLKVVGNTDTDLKMNIKQLQIFILQNKTSLEMWNKLLSNLVFYNKFQRFKFNFKKSFIIKTYK